MIVAVYKRSKSKERWMLCSVDKSAEEAKAKCKILRELSKQTGANKTEFAIQAFKDNEIHIPDFLSEIKPEKLIYN